MLELIFIFFSSFVIALSGAMMPGPLLTVTISESTVRGIRAGPLLIAGHGILEIILVVLLLFGLAPIFQMKEVFMVVAFSGAAVLCWMSYGMFRSIPTLSISNDQSGLRKNRILISGVVMSLANPYWFLWWATIGLGYLIKSRMLGFAGISAFMAGHISGDLAWYTAISVTVCRGRKLFNEKYYRRLVGFCAALLVVFAMYFLYAGLRIMT